MAFVSCKCHSKAASGVEVKFDAEEMWLLTEMQGKEVTLAEGQKKPAIQFNPEAGTFSGFSGCNRYFGQFKDLGKGKMELGSINGTKMACPEPFHKVEGAYLALLRRCDGYKIDEYTLQLTQRGKVLLSYEKVR